MTLNPAYFQPHVSSTFQSNELGQLTLEQVKDLSRDASPYLQFALSFISERDQVHPQGTYTLNHSSLPALEVFLVPVGKAETGIRYLASFSVER